MAVFGADDFKFIRELAKDKLVIDPYDETQLQAASYDFRLSSKFAFFNSTNSFINFCTEDGVSILPHAPPPIHLPYHTKMEHVFMEVDTDYYDLHPNDFILAQSVEWFEFPPSVAGMVKAKSTMGRLGIQVSNGDACWFDPGFKGYAVLELKNNGPFTIRLKAGMKIGQMIFMDVWGSTVKTAYSGNYREQHGFQFDKMQQSMEKIGRDADRFVKGKENAEAAS
jgi:dCTP deaminase